MPPAAFSSWGGWRILPEVESSWAEGGLCPEWRVIKGEHRRFDPWVSEDICAHLCLIRLVQLPVTQMTTTGSPGIRICRDLALNHVAFGSVRISVACSKAGLKYLEGFSVRGPFAANLPEWRGWAVWAFSGRPVLECPFNLFSQMARKERVELVDGEIEEFLLSMETVGSFGNDKKTGGDSHFL